MSNTKQIALKSSDGETFVVDEAVAMLSHFIKDKIEDDCAGSEIPLPKVTSQILAKVIEYCKRHVDAAADNDKTIAGSGHEKDESLKSFDAEFVKVDQKTLFDLILAAKYLNIMSLRGLTIQAAADMIKGKSPDEIRKVFNQPALTPEEAEQVRRENQWAFE